MRAPVVTPDTAASFLALLDYAETRSPGAACAFLRGFCAARSHEPTPDPRREPAEPPGPAHAAALARVELTRRQG